MRNVKWGFVALSVMTALVLFSGPTRAEQDEGNVVKWDAIIGVAAPGSLVGGFQPFGFPSVFPLVAQDGKAWVHLQTGHVKFSVRGLVLANSTALAVAGTTGVVEQVMGTLVCNGLTGPSDSADTPAVPLDPQGNANFVGAINVPTACLITPDKLAFLIRVAKATVQPAEGKWIAVGVVRTP